MVACDSEVRGMETPAWAYAHEVKPEQSKELVLVLKTYGEPILVCPAENAAPARPDAGVPGSLRTVRSRARVARDCCASRAAFSLAVRELRSFRAAASLVWTVFFCLASSVRVSARSLSFAEASCRCWASERCFSWTFFSASTC